MNPKYTKDENGKELLTITEKKDSDAALNKKD